jgi:hypothetical protein
VAKLRGKIESLEHEGAADAFAGTVLRDRERAQQQRGVAGLADQDRPLADGAHQSVVLGAVAFQRDPAQLADGLDAFSEQIGSLVEPCRAKHLVVQTFDGAA